LQKFIFTLIQDFSGNGLLTEENEAAKYPESAFAEVFQIHLVVW